MSDQTPRTTGYWARKWKLHRNVARRVLAKLHRDHGPQVVWRAGPSNDYVASEASLAAVGKSRRARAPNHNQHAGGDLLAQERDYVTQEQLQRAIAHLLAAFERRIAEEAALRKPRAHR